MRVPSATNKYHAKGYLLAHKEELGKNPPGLVDSVVQGHYQMPRWYLSLLTFLSKLVCLGPGSSWPQDDSQLMKRPASRGVKGDIAFFVSPLMSKTRLARNSTLNSSPCTHAGNNLHDSLPDGHANQNSVGVMISFHVNVANKH